MKTLKFEHKLAQQILSGQKTSTWRLYDDKDLHVNDEIKVIDKVDPLHDSTWVVIGKAHVTQIIEKRLEDIDDLDGEGHEKFTSTEDMLSTYRSYYGKRVDLTTPVKMVHFSFSPGDMQPVFGETLESARLYTDGGSRGNPGPSACAYVICNMDDNVVEKSGEYLGTITNNQAEYLGLVRGLTRAVELMIENLDVFMDSELVINQVNGFYKVKNVDLIPFHTQANQLAARFKKVTFSHVPRAMNKLADEEVNKVLDQNKP